MSIRETHYDRLLKDDMRRRERNVRLLTKLENIEKKAAFLQAKTDRIRSLKSIYKSHCQYPSPTIIRPNYTTAENIHILPERIPSREYNEYIPNYRNSYIINADESLQKQNQCLIMKNITLDEAIDEIARRYILIPKTPLKPNITEENYTTNIKYEQPLKTSIDLYTDNEKDILNLPTTSVEQIEAPISNEINDVLENKDDSSEKEEKAKESMMSVERIDDSISQNSELIMDNSDSAIKEDIQNIEIPEEPSIPNSELAAEFSNENIPTETSHPNVELTTEVAFNEEIGIHYSEPNLDLNTEVAYNNSTNQNQQLTSEIAYNEDIPAENNYVQYTEPQETYYDENQTPNYNDNVQNENLDVTYEQEYPNYEQNTEPHVQDNVPIENSANYEQTNEAHVEENYDNQYYNENEGVIQNPEQDYSYYQTDQYNVDQNEYQNNPDTANIDQTVYNQNYDQNQPNEYQNNPDTANIDQTVYNQNYDQNQPNEYQNNPDTANIVYNQNYDQNQSNEYQNNPDATDVDQTVYNQNYVQDQQNEYVENSNDQEGVYPQQDVNYDNSEYNETNTLEQIDTQETYNPEDTYEDNTQDYQQEEYANQEQYTNQGNEQYNQQYNQDNEQYNYYEQNTAEGVETNQQEAKPLEILDSDITDNTNKDETSVQESDFEFSTNQ